MVDIVPDTSQRAVVVGKKQDVSIGLSTHTKTLQVEFSVVGTILEIGVLDMVEGTPVPPLPCIAVPSYAESDTDTAMSATQADLSDDDDATFAEADNGDSLYLQFTSPVGGGTGTLANSNVRLRMTADDNGVGGAGERRVIVQAYATSGLGADANFFGVWEGSVPDNTAWYDDGLPVGPYLPPINGSIVTYPDSEAHWWTFINKTSSDWDTDGTSNDDPYPAISRLLALGDLTLDVHRSEGSPTWSIPAWVTAALDSSGKVTVAYESFLGFQGPRDPTAWDGATEYLMQSVTNNSRSYAVSVPFVDQPQYVGGFGYTETTSSSAPYQFASAFVRPGMVPLLRYFDTAPNYRIAVYGVADTTITALGDQPYPSQTFSATGFIRALCAWPDQTTVVLYGNHFASSAYTVEAFACTVNADGTMTTPVSLGNVTHTGGAFPGAGTDYLGNVSSPTPFSDRLSLQENTRGLYDRLTPTVIRDGYGLIPTTSGADPVRDQFFADPRAAPNHVFIARRSPSSGTNTYLHVADMTVSADGLTWAVAGQWDVPSGTTSVSPGITGLGKVVAYTSNGTTTRLFYDIFGAVQEFPVGPEITGGSGVGFVTPILPTMPAGDDAWLVNGGGTGRMYTMTWSATPPQTAYVKVSEASLEVPCRDHPASVDAEVEMFAYSTLDAAATSTAVHNLGFTHTATATNGGIGQWAYGLSTVSGASAYVFLDNHNQPSITTVQQDLTVTRTDWAYGGLATGSPQDMLDLGNGTHNFLFITFDGYIVMAGANADDAAGVTQIFGERRLVSGSADINEIGFMAFDLPTLTLYVCYRSTPSLGGQTVKKTTWSWDSFAWSVPVNVGTFAVSPQEDWNSGPGGFARSIRGISNLHRHFTETGRGRKKNSTVDTSTGVPLNYFSLNDDPIAGGHISYAYPLNATNWRSLAGNIVYGPASLADRTNWIEEWAYNEATGVFTAVHSLNADALLPAGTQLGAGYTIQSNHDVTPKYHLAIPYADVDFNVLGYLLIYDLFGEQHIINRTPDPGNASFSTVELMDLWWSAQANTPAVMVAQNTALDGSGTTTYGIDLWTHTGSP